MEKEIPVLTLDPDLEQLLQKILQTAGQEGAGIEPGLAEQLHKSLDEKAQKLEMEGHPAILLVASPVRPWLARFVRHSIPGLNVLAYNEIPEDRQVRVVASIGPRG
jgi:flagellar biosynthesis protein FlhA